MSFSLLMHPSIDDRHTSWPRCVTCRSAADLHHPKCTHRRATTLLLNWLLSLIVRKSARRSQECLKPFVGSMLCSGFVPLASWLLVRSLSSSFSFSRWVPSGPPHVTSCVMSASARERCKIKHYSATITSQCCCSIPTRFLDVNPDVTVVDIREQVVM